MEAILIIVGLFVLYEVVRQQQEISALGGSGTPPVAAPAFQEVAAQPSSAGQVEGLASQGVAAGLNFIPIVGPYVSQAFNAITGGLIAASQKRAAEARSENQAVGAAVPGWDKGVAQVVAAYNGGQLTAAEVEQILMAPQSNDPTVPSGQGVLWTAFWNECSPQIQPGRNGCQSGAVVQGKVSFCGGTTYGASCCVGYDNLKNSSVALLQALKQAQQTGKSTASVLTVYASKYGGVNRPGYTVTFITPTATSNSLLSSIGL